MKLRHVLGWKFALYELFLPALRQLGPAWADALLGGLGRIQAVLWPPRRWELTRGLARGQAALRAGWDVDAIRPALAANALRFLARDYPLDGRSDAEVLARFDIDGWEPFQASLDVGQGVIVVGSHLGAHVAALHGLYRRGVPLRLLVQRPRHVSRALNREFDQVGPHPQSEFFLRRDLPRGSCVERLLRARAALREGLAVYLPGDIPWSGPNTRPGRLLGQSRAFLSVWADLAVLTRSPVFFLFCTHQPDGRYSLRLKPLGTVSSGSENAAVARYFATLEAEISAHPADAVAHLLWPCYGPPSPHPALPCARPSRRLPSLS